MKKSFFACLSLLGLFIISSPADAVNATGTAKAIVVGELKISQTRALDFGTFSPGLSGGTVAVTGNGSDVSVPTTTTTTGSVTSLVGGAYPIFTITGDANRLVNFTRPGTATLTKSGGSATMLATFSGSPSIQFNISALGFYLVGLNATLTVAGSQESGTYNGTYTVTANY